MLEVILVISCYVTNNLKPDNVKQYMFSYFVSVGKEFACRLGVLVIIWVSSVIRLRFFMVHSRKEELPSSGGYWQGSVSHGMLDKGPQFFTGSWPPLVVCQTCLFSMATCFTKACKLQGVRDSLSVRQRPWAFTAEVREWHLSPLPYLLVRNKALPLRGEGHMKVIHHYTLGR